MTGVFCYNTAFSTLTKQLIKDSLSNYIMKEGVSHEERLLKKYFSIHGCRSNIVFFS